MPWCGRACGVECAPCHGPQAAHLPCRLNCQDPILLLFAVRCHEFVKITFQEKLVLLRQPLVAQSQLVLYFLQHVLLVCRYQCACRPIVYQDTPVNPLAVCHLEELRD